MYNRNLFTHTYLKKEFIGRSTRVGGFDYTSTRSVQAQANPLGIANASSKPKNLRTLTRN